MPDDRVYYVISDLHIGGDEQLERLEFREELLAFLRELAAGDENAELVINGDAFGLWELTGHRGPAKFDALLETYPDLFEQLRATGEAIDITLVPGNHDHELAAHPEYVERFAEYNVTLEPHESITRPIGDRVVHFEHGHQQDPNNRIEDFGNPAATPLGYFYNTHVTSRAGQLSERGRFNWLRDVQAVTPTELMPIWLVSKYVYREMNPLLRYAAVPFLLLFQLCVVLAVLAGLDVTGVWSAPVETTESLLAQLGLAGTAAYALLAVAVAVGAVLVLVSIPLFVLLRDVRQTLDRFGLFETDVTIDPIGPYERRARAVFEDEPRTAIYCYGHTHRPRVQAVDGRVMVNTGTWLKRLHRLDVAPGLLPPVFHPSFQLGYVRIAAEGEAITAEYVPIEKPSPVREELTLTERLLTIGRAPTPDVPGRATVEGSRTEVGPAGSPGA